MIIQPPHFFLKILWLDLKKMMKVDWPQWPRLIVIVKIIQTNWKTFYWKIWNLTKLDWIRPNQPCELLKHFFYWFFCLAYICICESVYLDLLELLVLVGLWACVCRRSRNVQSRYQSLRFFLIVIGYLSFVI